MSDSKSVSERESIDDLDRAIHQLSARIDAVCYQQLVLIREFDQRAGWLQWQFSNCAEWLAWRTKAVIPFKRTTRTNGVSNARTVSLYRNAVIPQKTP